MRITRSNAGNQSFLQAGLEGQERINPREMGLLDAGAVDGLLQPFLSQNGSLVLEYNISPLVSLEHTLGRITGQEQFAALVQKCISVFREMERHGLSLSRIVESFDCMFLYPADQSVYFAYLPVSGYEGRFSVPHFFLGLLDRTPCNSAAFAQFGAQYRAFLQRPSAFTLEELRSFVRGIHEAGQQAQPPQQESGAPPVPPAQPPAAPAGGAAPAPQPAGREPVWVTVPVLAQQAAGQTSTAKPPEPVPQAEWVRLKTGERFPVWRTPYIIGRDAARADLVIGDNPTVGRVHATVTRRDGGFFLTDNGSLNKSYLEGMPLEQGREYPLPDGAQVRLSDEKLVFRLLPKP